MLVILFKLIILINFLIYEFSYISLPLKIYENKNIDNILLLNEIKEEYLSVHLYKEIFIGEPKQKLIFILSPDEYNFYMVFNNSQEINENSYYYDYKKSKTNNLYFGENEVGSQANTFFLKEKFYFDNINTTNNQKEEIGVNDIDLVLFFKRPQFFKDLNLSTNVNSYIIFGLRLCEVIDRIEYILSLIRQLKKKNITENYKWFIDYKVNGNEKKDTNNHENDIQMVIGADPHDVYPNKYNEMDLRLVNAKSSRGFIFWGLKFDKIYYYKNEKKKDEILFELNNDININTTNFEEFLTGEIKHNFFFISSPKQYFDGIIKDFFNKLIIEKKCFIIGDNYKLIYCNNDSENKKYLKNNFKTLFFKHHEFNYIFKLKYKDLFLEYNNKILFLIITENNSRNIWTLGIPFLKKYLLSYDYDFKVIGFYQINNDEEEEINDTNYYYLKIFLIILLLVICGIFGFFLSRRIYRLNRKKRKNEIEEEYQYKEKDKDENQKNINDINDINKDIKDNKKESLIGLELGKI